MLKDFPRPLALRMVEHFSPAYPKIKQIDFHATEARALDEAGARIPISRAEHASLLSIRSELQIFFTAQNGFNEIQHLNYVDGVRVTFANGDIAHVRPSGNADELRIYAVADSAERAESIARLGIAEPDGILRRLQAALA